MMVIPLGMAIPATFPLLGNSNTRSKVGGLLNGTNPGVELGIGKADAPDCLGRIDPLPMNAVKPVSQIKLDAG
jgi:hypothetical protein